ncbi:MAG: membrane protein insertion efficiency factor YidD [Dehalococcoidales bacterium]|nr:membrane protein insertion efficiency factor YidD [Dehalococcoidales bacterium]
MKEFALSLIKMYQSTISRVLPSSCRFTPTCSEYTYEAINRYGIFKGIWMGTKRIARCNPFNPGGYDPVP